ncbi:MAG: hypothetical protein EBZ77_04160 [Chitinophagia bacterium]|nr:hypothetical protein [Chitinophagia bacterium]
MVSLGLEEATRLCEKYQSLAGTVTNESTLTIEKVAVVPFDESSRYRFFLYYLLFDGDAELALKQGPATKEFAVMVFARNQIGELQHQSLNDYLNNSSATGFTSHFQKEAYSDSLYL